MDGRRKKIQEVNILITGANGFIGNYFTNKYNTTYNINTFSFLNNSLEDLNLSNIDTIIHLSALVHQMSGASAEEYEKVNVAQTIDLANKAKENGIKHFIFMSTIKVYGEEPNVVYTEKSQCIPEDDYGKSKYKAEKLLQNMDDENFKVSIIRTPIVYGYEVQANIKKLISLLMYVPVLPFNDIENRRSMVYIGNLCHLIDIIIQKKQRGIFLAKDDDTISTKEFIHMITDELNKKIILIKIPFFKKLLRVLKPSLFRRLYESLEVDNAETKKVLDFENLYSTKEGVKCMMCTEQD